MKTAENRFRGKTFFCIFLIFSLAILFLTNCSNPMSALEKGSTVPDPEPEEGKLDTSRFLVAVEDEPDTVDFQCTSIYYTIATNVFNRLVEMEKDGMGGVSIEPSLARSWEISEDGSRYTFHLEKGVAFSNGEALTSSDVLYTMKRLLTHPDSCNRDIAEVIKGAEALERGETEDLDGFVIEDDLTFTITLEQPFAAFLACLSMPGASILDAETTEAAGDRFGMDAESTVGTGSYILTEWNPGEGMLLRANPDCFAGAPKNDGLDLRFIDEPEDIRRMFEAGELDILDLDEVGNTAEFFIHGDIYQDRLYQVMRIGTTYIALNEAVKPLTDVRVRKALQLALNREVLLDAVYSGRGSLVNGIFPPGLYGYNPDLPEIPFDPEEAGRLLAEAGYPKGLDLTASIRSSSTQWEMVLLETAAGMWEKIGIHVDIRVMDESEFMELRKNGKLACYCATWTADYNDPNNFIYTFFGTKDNTVFRSLCYPREDIMQRVSDARIIQDPDKRIAEYRELEKLIVQEDAAWIPLFTRRRYYVSSERVEGVESSWNGSVKNKYCCISIKEI